MKAWIDKWIVTNWGTKAMAVGLALLLWVYLHEESTDSGAFTATFVPDVQNQSEFARLVFSNTRGDDLDGKLSIQVTGPKGDLRVLSKKGIRCEPRVNEGYFSRNIGSFYLDLQESDLNLPEAVSVDFGKFSRVRVDYVRFNEAEFDLLEPDVTGSPIAGFELAGVTVRPARVKLRFPADHRPEKIRLKPVSIDKRASSFSIDFQQSITQRMSLRRYIGS